MPASFTTASLNQAGRQLLRFMLERARQYGDAFDSADYVVVEHWIQDILETCDLEAAFVEAQDEFCSYASDNAQWMGHFERLLRFGGVETEAFCRNMWLAFFFMLSDPADALWDQYGNLQRATTSQTGLSLPDSWGDWIAFIQDYMHLAARYLVAQSEHFASLFVATETLQLLEDMPGASRKNEAPAAVPFQPIARFNEATLAAYLTACAHQVGHIDPRGYPRSIHTTVPLSDVYIPLLLVPLSACDRPAHLMRYQLTGRDDPELAALREPLADRELEAHPGEEVHQALARHQLVLILGQSGAGKTTLLRNLALEHARLALGSPPDDSDGHGLRGSAARRNLPAPIPIYIDLAGYIEDPRAHETLEAYLLRAAVAMTQDDAVAPLLSTLLQGGQCLILLDGLDQATSDDQRRMLVASVAQASMEWRAAGNRIVVTSRFSGYDITPLPREFVAYIIRPLERQKINSLLLRWKLTLARMQRPLMGDAEVMRQAHNEMLALARQITGNPRLHAMANTPLLLRLLAGIYHPHMAVSPQPVAILQQVAESLVREWRLPQTVSHRPTVLEKEVTPLLGELAFWLQASRATGMVHEGELREILGNVWGQMHPEASPEQVSAAIGDFMGRVRVHSGPLVELEPQRYGFVFQGIQEYYAARCMVTGYLRAARRIREHLHDPRWNEVIMLAISYMALHSIDDASALIEAAILARGKQAAQFGHASSPFESLLKRDLFFAAQLLGSGVEVRADLSRYIVEQLMQLWLQGGSDSLGRFNLVFDRARRHLLRLEGTSSSLPAFQIAVEALRAAEEHEQAFAIDAVTLWPSYLELARDELAAFDRDAPTLVRRAVASALGRTGPLSRKAYLLLLTLASDGDEHVSLASQRTLDSAPPLPSEIVIMWVDYLKSGEPTRQRVGLRRLQNAGPLPPQVIGELLRLLDSPDPLMRRRAVDTLAHAPSLPLDALIAVCRAADSTEPALRVAAINVLARPVELPPEIVHQLVRWSDDPDVGVRFAAVQALSACLNDSPEVIAALIERLGDPSDSIRAAVADPLARKGQDQSQALHMLAHMADDPIYQVRVALAQALRHIPEPNPEMRRTLQMLLNDIETIVREAALQTIKHLRVPGADIVDYLISLATTPDHPIGLGAVRALAALRGLDDDALLALLCALPVHAADAGEEIKACLHAHVPLSQDVINQVMDLAVLRDVVPGQARGMATTLRALALEVLGYTLDTTSAALQILLDATQPSENVTVRTAALRGLAHARAVGPSVLDALQALLDSSSFEVRCAAAVTLGHLIRSLPDPALTSDQMMVIARRVADLLHGIAPCAAWDTGSGTQNELLWALSWIVERARPGAPRLPDGLEQAAGEFD
jgi:HEAT repeat protein